MIRIEGEAAHYCPNAATCPPQVKGRVEHFIARKAMNIDGIGTETIDLLYKNHMINDVADLYTLHPIQLMTLDRMGEKIGSKYFGRLRSVKRSKFCSRVVCFRNSLCR